MSSHRRFTSSHVYPAMDVGPEAYYEGGGTQQGTYGQVPDAVEYVEQASAVRWGPMVAEGIPLPLAVEFAVYDLFDAEQEAERITRGYGITTDLSKTTKTGGGVLSYLDYLWGGYEEEDIKASPTAGGINVRTGAPMDPNAAASVARSIEGPDEDEETKPPEINWRNLGIAVGVLGGGFFVWKQFVEPRLAKKGQP
jgi:hypothetical protein